MPRQKTYDSGKYKSQFLFIDVTSFDQADLIGRSPDEVRSFARVLIGVGYVHTPILSATWEDKETLVEGTKRVSACRWILSLSKEEYKSLCYMCGISADDIRPQQEWKLIPCFRHLDVPPAEQDGISVSANEHRSDNPINAFVRVKHLEREQKWDEIADLWKFSQQKWKEIEVYGNLADWEAVTDAFNGDLIAQGSVKELAKLNKVLQEPLIEKLKEGEKVTLKEIRAQKNVDAGEALNRQPEVDFGPPDGEDVGSISDGLYFFDSGKKKTWFEQYLEASNYREGKTGKLYRCVEI